MAISEERICHQCDTSLAPNGRFCTNCGAKYREPAVLNPMQPASSASAQSPAMPVGQLVLGPVQPASFKQSPAVSTPSFPPSQPFPPKKGPNIGIVLGAVCLIVVVVGAGIFFISKLKSGTSATSNRVFPVATSSPALFADSFADNGKGWMMGDGDGFSSTISNNTLSLSDANHKIIDAAIPGSGNNPAIYSDFLVTTTFTIANADQNDSVGLYLRGDNDLKQGYFVDIFGDNTYDIVKVFPDANKDSFLVSPTSSSDINAVGQQNKLTVIMKGSKMVLLINDKLVNSISDSGYTNGQIALFAENSKTSIGVKAVFRSVAVYSVPAQLPG